MTVANECDRLPDWGMAFATLAAADRLLVLGEPVGALLEVSCEQYKRRCSMAAPFPPLGFSKGGKALTTGLPAVTAGCLASSDCKLNQDTHTISSQLTNPEPQRQI